MTKQILVLCMTLMGTLLGCSSPQNLTQKPEAYQANPIKDYEIGVGDSLLINVWKNQELSMQVPVRPDGKISLPLVGDIVAQGFTAKQLTSNITEALKTYLKTPQVAVIVQQAGSADYLLRVRVTGAVRNPISIPFREGMTVLDIVLEAGGGTEYASLNSAKLYRRINGEVKVYPVRLKDILNKGKLTTNYDLIPSDIVTIPERIL